MEHLTEEASRLLHNSLATNTHSTYNTALQQFTNFRIQYNLAQSWPAPVDQLLHYLAFMSVQGRSFRTTQLYVSAISHFHKLQGHFDTTKVYIVFKTLQGIRKTLGIPKDIRVPISLQLLANIIQVLPTICRSPYESSLFIAAYCLAYFGLLRISEVLTLQLSNLHFQPSGNITLTIPKSKTDQLGHSTTVQIQSQYGVLRPPTLILGYIKIRPGNHPTLLIHVDGKPITRFQFQSILQKSLSSLNVPGHYRSHRFRIGMATELANLGISHSQIQTLGRWSSNAFLSYIRPIE